MVGWSSVIGRLLSGPDECYHGDGIDNNNPAAQRYPRNRNSRPLCRVAR